MMQNRLGVASMVILIVYVTIGFLDSIHFREAIAKTNNESTQHYSTTVYSVLDKILAPVGDDYEKTYSSPFSIHLFVKNTIMNSNGERIRDYPRLKYAGLHIKNADQKYHDILIRSITSVIKAVIFWCLFFIVFLFMISWRGKIPLIKNFKNIILGRTGIAWRTFFLTWLVLFILLFWCYDLSRVYHIFGTDTVGQDVFFQAFKSIRTGLIIGTLTTLIMLPFAILMGTMAGFFGGWIDDIIQYIYTTLNSVPGVLLIAASVLSLQIFIANHPNLFPTLAARADARLLALCFILGITSWTSLCRMLRGETLKLREVDYIQAARSLGTKSTRIISRHILPNVMHIIIISVVLDFSGLVLAEAVLSYVGVGVDPTTHSWGNMINAARLQLAREPVVWWPLLAAFIFMFVLVLSANLFSDAVRDAFDPRIKTAT